MNRLPSGLPGGRFSLGRAAVRGARAAQAPPANSTEAPTAIARTVLAADGQATVETPDGPTGFDLAPIGEATAPDAVPAIHILGTPEEERQLAKTSVSTESTGGLMNWGGSCSGKVAAVHVEERTYLGAWRLGHLPDPRGDWLGEVNPAGSDFGSKRLNLRGTSWKYPSPAVGSRASPTVRCP
jgi:hypothetical protein